MVYYLPKTLIEVQVTATKVTYTPGELCQYANRYLRLNNISSQPSEYWEIKDVKAGTIGVPDTDKVYSIKLKDKMVTSQVELTETGIIKAINTTAPKEKEVKQEAAVQKPQRIDLVDGRYGCDVHLCLDEAWLVDLAGELHTLKRDGGVCVADLNLFS